MKSVLALIFLFSLSAFAQTTSKHVPDERHFPLVQVNVSGSTRYTPQVITSSLGLRVGQQTSQKELEAASQKLANSGLFSLVQFRFGWAGNGVVANFDLSDNPNLVPVDFENFVWFTSSELAGALRKKLPLFTGVVPLSGDLRDQVQNELQQLLRDKNISGTVTAIPHGALNRPVEAMFFRVDGHDIKITSCDFQGADHANTIALGEIAKYITNLEYEKTAVASTIQARLKNLYDNLGYLSALVNDPVTP